jgi:hypothetical protein
MVRKENLEIEDLDDRRRRDAIAQEIAQREDIGDVDDFLAAWHTAIEFFHNEDLAGKPG